MELAITDQNPQAASGKIRAGYGRETFDHSTDANLVIRSSPSIALQHRAERETLIAIGPADDLDKTGTPARPREHAEIVRNRLLQIDNETIIRAHLPCLRNIWIVRGSDRHGKSVSIAPHVGDIRPSHQSQFTRLREQRIPQFQFADIFAMFGDLSVER